MRISAKQLAQTLFDLTDGKMKAETEKSVADFARYIYRNRKLKMAGKIIENFGKMYNQKNGIVEAEVVTAEKLSASAEIKVKEYIEKKYTAKEVIVKNTIDENIRGGIIVKVEDEVMDGSVKRQLTNLRRLLTH